MFMNYKGDKIADGARDLGSLERIAGTLPAPERPEALLAMEKDLAAGKAAHEQGDHARAAGLFNKVLAGKVDGEPKAEARRLLAEIDEVARGPLEEARGQLGSDPLAAHEALRKVARDFGGTPSGDEADRLARQLEDEPSFKALVEAREADSRNARWLEEAREKLEEADYLGAHKLLQRIVESGAQGPALDEAAKLVADIEGDPAKMKALREAEAEKEVQRTMSLAKNYVLNGRKDRAIEKLEAVAKEFDGTDWAEKAREMIRDIEAGRIR